MHKPRCRAQLVLTIVLVVGLHTSIVWTLWTTSRVPSTQTTSERLEFVFIAPTAEPAASMPRDPLGRVTGRVLSQRRNAANTPARVPDLPGANAESTAIHPPIDWAAELSRAAQDAATGKPTPNTREFGFPHPSATPDKPAQFAWNYAATHRVESLPQGGLLIHLNDNCVLLLFPFPFVACAIGKIKANGNLFEHMRDP
jgi:hypothetical protein